MATLVKNFQKKVLPCLLWRSLFSLPSGEILKNKNKNAAVVFQIFPLFWGE
jgi:hypothetical protein